MSKGNGGTRGSGRPASKPSYVYERETEKAVMVGVEVYVEYAPSRAFTSSLVRDRTLKGNVWIPKSQIENGSPTNWILNQKAKDFVHDRMGSAHIVNESWMQPVFRDANGKVIEGVMSQRQKTWQSEREVRYNQGKARHEQLYQQAKQMGIKGVRINMTSRTLEEKIKNAKQ